MARVKPVVPDDYMIPIGNEATRETGRCADNWTDSQVSLYRSKLPAEYHAVPIDALRSRWINLRKDGKLQSVSGHGPSKGWKAKKEGADPIVPKDVPTQKKFF